MLAIDRHQEAKADELLASVPPDDPTLAKLRGRLAIARRDGPTAVRCFRLAYAQSPDDRDAVLGLANALTIIGDHKSAAPLRELARKFELLNSLVQRAAVPAERNDPRLVHDLAPPLPPAAIPKPAVGTGWQLPATLWTLSLNMPSSRSRAVSESGTRVLVVRQRSPRIDLRAAPETQPDPPE